MWYDFEVHQVWHLGQCLRRVIQQRHQFEWSIELYPLWCWQSRNGATYLRQILWCDAKYISIICHLTFCPGILLRQCKESQEYPCYIAGYIVRYDWGELWRNCQDKSNTSASKSSEHSTRWIVFDICQMARSPCREVNEFFPSENVICPCRTRMCTWYLPTNSVTCRLSRYVLIRLQP